MQLYTHIYEGVGTNKKSERIEFDCSRIRIHGSPKIMDVSEQIKPIEICCTI